MQKRHICRGMYGHVASVSQLPRLDRSRDIYIRGGGESERKERAVGQL